MSSICVATFTNVASSTVTINFKPADIKLESSEAYLQKLEKNLSYGFEIIDIFCKNTVLNICRYLKCFYICKKINNIFLKFDLFFKDAKNHGNRLNIIIPTEEHDSKT